MKGILVIVDGMGDLPCKQLDGKTPLESAETPNLNYLASHGDLGQMISVKKGFIPESDEAIVSIFGNELISSTRGQLEANGTDVKLVRGDLALRVNFGTIDYLHGGNVIDRRAGRTLTTDEAKILAKEINKIKMPVKFSFIPTIQHRAVVVFRGGFSDNISGNDATYFNGNYAMKNKINFCKPLDDEDNSEYTANIVNEFLEKVYEVLRNHPINFERKKRGLLPANYLFVRGAGIEKPKLKQYSKWISTNYMPLEIGFSKVSGIDNYTFDYPKMKNSEVYDNLYEGLKKACEHSIKVIGNHYKEADYAYVHIKETDLPGHDDKPHDKKKMIEFLDKTLFKFLREFVTKNKIKVVVTADHCTPCNLKNHSADAVPVLFYNNSEEKSRKFCEKECAKGAIGTILGKDLLKVVGFLK